MSQNIDKRIVEMRFDNKQFESGIQTSVKSLDELKKGLDFDKAIKGLSGLEKAGRSFTLSGISDGVSAISDRFTAMGIIGTRVLQNITDSAYNCGKRIASVLTIDPVKMGFSEYETQIGAIQTILANTSDAMDKAGYSQQKRLDIVNDKLDELNAYADKTIYNFTEMTRNIGTFTAAGVELDTAVSSIQGIANLAAVSGSTSQQASTAMYQLSQAISTGTVRLMDWNSVVNAGMGGELFQKALIRTADAMGAVGDESREAFEKLKSGDLSFRESLSSEWLTSDVLTETLSQMAMDFEAIAKARGITLEEAKHFVRDDLLAKGYTIEQAEEIVALAEAANDAATKVKTFTQLFDTLKESLQSGWTQSWEFIIGDFEEAKKLLTSISDYFGAIIGKSADSRNAILADWKALGGRRDLIHGFWNIVHSIENVVNTFKSAFQEFFPPATGQQLANITKRFKEITAKIRGFTQNSEKIEKLARVFRGIAAGLDIIRTAAGWAWGGLKKLLGITKGAVGEFLDFSAGIGDWVVGLRDSIKNSETLQGILSGLGDAVTSIRDLVVGGIKKIGTFFGKLWNQIEGTGIFSNVGNWFRFLIGKIPEFVGQIQSWSKSILDWAKSSETLKAAWANIKGFFEPIIQGISEFGRKLWEAIQSFFGADTSGERTLWEKIKVRFSAFGEKIGEWFEMIKPKLTETWENVKAFLSNLFAKAIPNFITNLKMKAIGKWPWLEKVFAFFEATWAKVKAFCDPIIAKIRPIGEKLWEAIKNLFGGGQDAPKESEISFGESLKNLLTDDWEKIKAFFSDFFTITIPQWFEKFKGVDWGSLIKTALGIFAGLKLLSAISGIGKIGKGLSAIGNGLVGFGDFLKDTIENGGITQIVKHKDSFATSLLKVAAAIGIMVAAIVVLANMEAEKAWKGIGLLTLLAGELLAITALFKMIDANGDALLKAAAAVSILVIPIYILGNMDTRKALKGIFGVGLVLTELAFFMKIAGKGMNGKQSFIGLAIAVNLLVFAVKGLSDMDTGALLKGVIGLGAVMFEMSLFMNKTNAKKISGLIAMAIAMNLMVRAVRKMGNLDTKTIIKGVLGIGGIIAAFAVLMNASKGMSFGSTILMLISMVGSMFLFIEMFKQTEGMNMDNMLKFAASISAVMLSMSIAMKVISMIPIGGALTGLGGFSILILGVGGLITALGWLQSEWGGLTGFLEGGGMVLGQIGRALGKFVGGIAGGFMEGLNLPQIGTDLSNFMTNAQGFVDGAKKIDGSAVSGVSSLAGAILVIAGTEFLSALVSLFAGENPVTKFSKDIVTLGQALTAYAFSVLPMAIVPQSVLDRSVSVATTLAGVARQIPANGGVVKFITGVPDFKTFSDNIKTLGTGLAAFAIEISTIDDRSFNQTKINAVVSVGTALAALEKSLEGQGGLEDVILGTKSLAKFALNTPAFGAGITAFMLQAKMLVYDEDKDGPKIDAIISVGSRLAELEKSLEGQGGLEDVILGTKSLAKFALNTPAFGAGITAFMLQAKMLRYEAATDDPKMDSMIAIGLKLAELEKSLEGQGGLEDIILGTKSLAKFGKDLPEFAIGLNHFITQTSALDDEKYDDAKIEKALDAATAINELNKRLAGTGGFMQGFFGTQDLGLFAENVKKVGEALSSFSTSVSGATVDKAEDAVTALDVIRTFTDTLSPEGSLWQKIGEFFGGSEENTLIGYAKNMRIVGTDLNTFSTQIESVNISNIGKASDVIDAIGEFLKGLATSGGFVDWWNDIWGGSENNTLKTIGSIMAQFGTDIGTLATGILNIEITTVNFEKAKTLFRNFKSFNDEVTAYTDVEYSDQMYDLLYIFDDFGTCLVQFQNNLGTTDAANLSTASRIIETLVNLAGSAANIKPENVSVLGSILEEYGKISFQGFITGFTEVSGDAVMAVNGIINQIVIAIQNDTTVSAAVAKISRNGIAAIKGTAFNWFNTGASLGRGIANGISSMAGSIRNSAINAANGAIYAIRNTWSIHSPSKVGEELGHYWDLGISGGIDKYANLVSQSSAGVGKTAIDTAKSVLNNLSYMTDDIDSEPTIRPVLDLSDVTNGFQTIDNLFNAQRAVNGAFFSGTSSLRNGRALMTEQNSTTNRNDNRDVVNELQNLSKRFDNLSSAVANMQVVLDTGVLVGQTASQMDAQLGAYASRRGRGN